MKSCSVTIQMKATEKYFPLVLFNMLLKVIESDWLSLWMNSFGVTIQMKAPQRYFNIVIFI